MSKPLDDAQEDWERDRKAWNLPPPRSQASLPQDLLRSLKESAAAQTVEKASSQRPTPASTRFTQSAKRANDPHRTL